MVEQRTAWRFDDADAFSRHLAPHHPLIAEDIGVEQQFPDGFDGVQQLDHPCPMVGQRHMNRLAIAERHEFLPFFLRQWGRDKVAVVDAGQRSHPIPALLRSQRVDEGKFHVAPRLHLLAEHLGIASVVQVVEQNRARFVSGPQPAMIEVQRAVSPDQAEIVGADGGEISEIARILAVGALDQFEDATAPLNHQIEINQQGVALLQGQRLVDATRNRPGAVDPLASSGSDNLLPILAQPHALPSDVGVIRHHPPDIAVSGGIVEIEQEIWRGQMKKMHGVRLQRLAIMHQPADLLGGRRDFQRADQLIDCLGRR